MHFKLVQYNIWHGTYFEKLLDFLQREDADVVCVQEICTRGRGFEATTDNMVVDIEQQLSYHSVFSESLVVGEGEAVWNFGVAIFSKKPFIETKKLLYGGTTRAFQLKREFNYNWPSSMVMARIQDLPISIATTHLPVTRQTTVTEKQMGEACEVRAFLADEHEFILCGDMNTLPYSGTYEILAEGLTDATDPDAPTLHPTIHDVGYKKYHVDYVFYKSERLSVTSSKIPVVDASDHLPVVVEFDYA